LEFQIPFLLETLKMKHYHILLCFLFALAFACKPTKETVTDFVYFEKNLDTLNSIIKILEEPRIKHNDILSINVSSASLDQTQTEVFNLMNNPQAGGGGGAGGAGGMALRGYLVDYDGSITMPIVGKIPVVGLTKNQLADTIKFRLDPYVKNPILNIRFMNFQVLVMGEIAGRGWQSFPNERATVVEAVMQAGGLTDLGSRENVMVIREMPGGQRQYRTLNLNDAKVFADPWYQLQQNDIVYALPNETRLLRYQRQNSPFFRDLPVFMGLITSIIGFMALMVALFR
jgi:polysaccharide export outer membrane protein